jgi:cyclohexadienyl dehydratase
MIADDVGHARGPGQADRMITDATETRWQAQQHPELCAPHPEAPFTFSEKAQNHRTYDRFTRPRLG